MLKGNRTQIPSDRMHVWGSLCRESVAEFLSKHTFLFVSRNTQPMGISSSSLPHERHHLPSEVFSNKVCVYYIYNPFLFVHFHPSRLPQMLANPSPELPCQKSSLPMLFSVRHRFSHASWLRSCRMKICPIFQI